MARYRKRPVVIEARQFTTRDFEDEVVQWAGAEVVARGCIIHTLEGDHLARPGDWIIQGVSGEFYPCKPDVFEKTYEPAD